MDRLVAKAVPETELASEVARFERDLKELAVEIERLRGFRPEWRPESTAAWVLWYNMVRNAGPGLIEGILNNRVIPPGKAKAVEMTARLFRAAARGGRARFKGPKDMVAWYDANHARLELVVTAIKSWPLKSEETAGEQMFKVGPFVVHNTLALTGDKLATVKELLLKGIAAARNSILPGFERTLYGEVFLVGQIARKNWAAWYQPGKDEIFVRPMLRVGHDDVQTLVHELAHRYWDRFLPPDVRQAWSTHDTMLRYTSAGNQSVESPKDGEPLALALRKGEAPPIVQRVDRALRRIYLVGGGFVALDRYLDVLHKIAQQRKFPTPYSATASTEHFAEAAGLQAVGRLEEPHLEAFKQVAKGEKPMQHMAGSYVHISREDFEEWLDSLRFLSEKWRVKQGTVGVYVLPLSDRVAVEVSSTVGKDDAVMGKGQASMQLRLVSRITGQVINKKAQGQSHFARTLNWRRTWLDGVERMRDAYLKSAGFYDAIAEIEDRAKYQREVTQRIEARANWQNDHILRDFHDIVQRDGVLTIKQKALLDRILDQRPPAPPKPEPPPPPAPAISQPAPVRDMLERTRDLWRAGRDSFDVSLMTFAKSIGEKIKAGHPLNPSENAKLNAELGRRHLAHRVAARWLNRR